MSLHKSLKSYKFRHKKRSVRKRWERFADAQLKGQKSVFGLPKEKILKARKQKPKEKEEKIEPVVTLSPTETKKIKKKSKDIGKIK